MRKLATPSHLCIYIPDNNKQKLHCFFVITLYKTLSGNRNMRRRVTLPLFRFRKRQKENTLFPKRSSICYGKVYPSCSHHTTLPVPMCIRCITPRVDSCPAHYYPWCFPEWDKKMAQTLSEGTGPDGPRHYNSRSLCSDSVSSTHLPV